MQDSTIYYVSSNGQPHDTRVLNGCVAAEHSRTEDGRRLRRFPVRITRKPAAA